MKKFMLLSLIAIVLGALTATGLFLLFNRTIEIPSPLKGNQVTQQRKKISGTFVRIRPQTSTITLKDANNHESSYTFYRDTQFLNEKGGKITLTDFQKGFPVTIEGLFDANQTLEITTIKITKTPNIIVYIPKSNDTVAGSIHIEGIARVFENVVSVRLLQANTILLQTTATATALDVGQYGSFVKDILIPRRTFPNQPVTLEVYQSSAKDGTAIDMVTIPLQRTVSATKTP